ncbi:hypothetical protein KI387_031623, partial [Taxus chinensis]
EELKKENQALNICTTPEAVIRTRIILEENEVLKAIKDETLGHAKQLSLIKKNHEAFTVAQEPHKERLDELGKLIAQKIDLLEGRMTSMSSIVL